MMTNHQIRSVYNKIVSNVGELEAYSTFAEKYPDYVDELDLLVQGELEDEPAVKRVPLTDIADLMSGIDDDNGDDTDDVTCSFDDDNEDVVGGDTPGDVEPEQVVVAPTPAKTTKSGKPVVRRSESKQAKAFALYEASPDKSSSTIIPLFMSTFDMTINGARTYFQNAKKKFGS